MCLYTAKPIDLSIIRVRISAKFYVIFEIVLYNLLLLRILKIDKECKRLCLPDQADLSDLTKYCKFFYKTEWRNLTADLASKMVFLKQWIRKPEMVEN